MHPVDLRVFRRAIPAIAAVVSMASCGTPVSDAERVSLQSRVVDCLSTAALALDDQKSDPAAIAMGIMPSCDQQYLALVDAIAGQTSDPQTQIMIRNQMTAKEIQFATSAVLHVRQLLANKGQR